ncbi:hypothetical protein CWM66_12580 [Kosakonia sp. H7A]|uniref:alpha/beta hydrolase n=1 Tax=Kosakonia sp. H7A TaxID=2054598 RepID=UPI000D167790|nr:alpha/beta hydrolase [Kosakonia sp. H7A]PTA92024.1 hypothetical protein CWM66_12580 [Kosakonia sp. H7A]
MIIVNINNLKDKLPKKYVTLSSRSFFLVNVINGKLLIEENNKTTEYSLETLDQIIAHIIQTESITIPDNWRRITHRKNDFYYLRVVAIDYLTQYHRDVIGFISPEIINICLFPEYYHRYIAHSLMQYPWDDRDDLLNIYSLDENYVTVEEEKFEIVPINYATTRVESDDGKYYDEQRDKKINYGVINVSIPKHFHRPGYIEKPFRLLGISFSKEDPNKHFIVHSHERMGKDEFFQQLSGSDNSERIVIFVHGYNVSFKEAAFKAAQVKYDLKITNPLLLLSWPSYSKIKDYAYDKASTITSAILFSNLFDELDNNPLFENTEISVIAHSMGNMLLSQIVSHISLPCVRFKRAALAAADITQNEFLDIFIDFFKNVFSHITIYVNENDKALKASKMLNKSPLVGDSSKTICVHTDIDTIDTTGFDGKFGELYHSYFSSNERVFDDIRQFLIDSIPVSHRGLFKKYTASNLPYWKLADV